MDGNLVLFNKTFAVFNKQVTNKVRLKTSISTNHQNSLFDEHNKEFAEQQAEVCIVSTPWIPNLARSEATAGPSHN